MIVSTKSRYILRVIIDLAENQESGLIPMKEIASRQNISLKYLERLLPLLVKNNLIEGVSGKGGGYRLLKKPSEYNVGKLIRLVEGEFAPVSCLEANSKPCKNKNSCRTFKMWIGLNKTINDYLDNYKISDLMKK